MNTIRQSEIGIQAKAEVPAEDTDRLEQSDLYYHGIIRRLSPRKGTGVVRTASGRDVRFSYQMVRMSGPLRSPKGLRGGDGGGIRRGLGRPRSPCHEDKDLSPNGPGPSSVHGAGLSINRGEQVPRRRVTPADIPSLVLPGRVGRFTAAAASRPGSGSTEALPRRHRARRCRRGPSPPWYS